MKRVNQDDYSKLQNAEEENNKHQSQLATRESLMEHDANKEKENRKAKEASKTFRRLFGYSLKHKQLLIFANIGMMVSSGGMILLPLLCGNMIDQIKENGDLTQGALRFIIMTVFMALFSAIRGYSFMLLGQKVCFQMRKELFGKLLEKDIEYFDKVKSGDLLSRLTSDVTTVYSASSDNISMLLRNFLQFLGSLIFLWVISWKLTLFIIVLTPIITFVIFFLIKLMKRLQKEYSNNLAFANSLASQVFGNIRVVRSFSNERNESKNYENLLQKVYLTGKRKHFLYGIMLLIMTVFANFLILSIMYFGGQLVIDGEISIGDLTSFILYTITLTVGFASVSGIFSQIISALGVCEHLFEIIDQPIKIEDGKKKLKLKNSKQENLIQFKNANFSYPSKPTVEVLKGINLKIKNGQSIAIVGPSGSGKSSIVNLILRFYDLNSGQLLINGKDIKDIQLENLRRQVGYVSQEPTLFSGNLRQNVEYGLLESQKSEEKVLKALEVANAKQFALNQEMFPERLKTLVGERGVKLSGGQKQRIAIARCIIKDPSLLIFDEATSALDAQSEYVVQKAIDGLLGSKDRTMIIVAHRLSTIINCDRIIVIKSGEIAEQGTHKQLLALKGIYANLVQKQLSTIPIKTQ